MATDQALEGVLTDVMHHIGVLHKLIDNIALVDMLCSFALLASEGAGAFVRPKVEDSGPLAILEGRNPLVEATNEAEFLPNDTFISELSSFHIITGPNNGGKSTYIKQVRKPSQR